MAIKKKFLKSKPICKCTFVLPKKAASEAEQVALVGDFNNWHKTSHPMKQLKNGDFKIELDLPAGQNYQFRYLIDNKSWENDWEADAYVQAEGLSAENSVVNC